MSVPLGTMKSWIRTWTADLRTCPFELNHRRPTVAPGAGAISLPRYLLGVLAPRSGVRSSDPGREEPRLLRGCVLGGNGWA